MLDLDGQLPQQHLEHSLQVKPQTKTVLFVRHYLWSRINPRSSASSDYINLQLVHEKILLLHPNNTQGC
jgi:hypothetical protein